MTKKEQAVEAYIKGTAFIQKPSPKLMYDGKRYTHEMLQEIEKLYEAGYSDGFAQRVMEDISPKEQG